MYMAMIKAGIPAFVLARLWLYYAIRYIEGNVSQDVGGNIGDAYRILAANGVPDEKYYPYDVSKFAVWPGPTVDQKAFDSRGIIDINYHPISSVDDVLLSDVEKASTAVFGVVFGHTVSEEFCQTQPNGTIHTPKSGSKVGGGHCQVVVGHDRQNQRFKVKNSWSDDWGDPTAGPGCWWMGYDYFLDSTWGASDCWIVLTVPSGVSQ
jgi:C1A family cysteine protease